MTRKTIIAHPDETQVGQDKQITLDNSMSIDDIRDEIAQVETVGADFHDHAANLAFMDEIVEVMVFPSSDKYAEQVVDVYNNGTPQRFIRGKWQNVKRKFVEVLARAKPFNVTTPETTDANGNRTTRIDTYTGLRYPFEMRDRNPRGASWLQGILAEGN